MFKLSFPHLRFYSVNVSELTPPDSIIFSGITASDADSGFGANGQINFFVDPASEAKNYFRFPNPAVGALQLIKQLDFETR